ncbi:hypothetical protein BU26DRAFT_502302 [Trematosphaeria pertusa]|uniref:Uncharacterized protein n=1 Tax=Trematosphaeria pertusa TaxID=390896 RepID=A0A6A6INK7_9PLEO|nr:uncharacterized protein BU26DRAFT_502302 [Trematosphaeria pertusa]KAF2251678.1 hypothetical protein BU26DRAFT_502302 [Trematosphaeria pertusa]
MFANGIDSSRSAVDNHYALRLRAVPTISTTAICAGLPRTSERRRSLHRMLQMPFEPPNKVEKEEECAFFRGDWNLIGLGDGNMSPRKRSRRKGGGSFHTRWTPAIRIQSEHEIVLVASKANTVTGAAKLRKCCLASIGNGPLKNTSHTTCWGPRAADQNKKPLWRRKLMCYRRCGHGWIHRTHEAICT